MLRSIFLLVIIAATGLFAWTNLKTTPPCVEPITYAIGSFDRRFDITQKEFLSALAEAEAIWEMPSGRNLFAHSPERYKLPVHLIYDYRQEATEELAELESKFEESESNYRILEGRLENLKVEYESLEKVYEAKVSELSERNSTYEALVERWNAGPRTSKKDFDNLERERIAINAEIDELKVFEINLNRKVAEINSLVDRLNRIARALNLNVEEYNIIGASRGETFEGGIYYTGPEGEGINIYEFENREKLVRILAHELGHALGIEHVDDPEAIMYHLNQGEAAEVTTSDLEALENICKTK